ncbi:hypothetical protein LINGRAHAP2_LOCUS6327 [Linum grandiflorum]
MDEDQLDCIGSVNGNDSPLTLEPPGICDYDRETELLPRIGDQYQVPTPPLVTKSVYLDHHTAGSFAVGLPISIMWIKEQGETIKKELEDFLDDLASSKADSAVKSESFQPMDVYEKGNEGVSKSYHLVPGDCDEEWNDADEASFVLGLYIFGKNLVQVQSFVETKTMGQILSFYYGKFYSSDRYRRWSQCGKLKGRRRMFGQRIFTGSRQQDLLSRLIPRLSEESNITLHKVTKCLGEGKMTLEDYVFALKAAVGLNALVEAVGIGTITAMDSLRSNHVTAVKPEIPVGKDCSKLTPLQIVNILTGGYRLSKTRSNDIFWEAVWPRLLARGWHSEQPKDGFRNSLVFIVPDIKKFSRRKLVKGDHYFDSVTDVLNKVASDPSLLELDVGGDEGTNFEQQDSNRHCYLKPRSSSVHNSNSGTSFTIVDTSGKMKKITQLKRLPAEVMNLSDDSSDEEYSSSEEPTDESYSAGNSSVDEDEPKRKFSKSVSFDSHFHGKQDFLVNGYRNKEMQPRKKANPQAIRKRKASNGNVAAPAAKRHQKKKALPCDSSKVHFRTYDDLVGPRLPSSSSSRGNSPNRSDVCHISTTSSGAEHSNEHIRSTKALIDLNIPAPQTTEEPECMMTEIEDGKQNGISKTSTLASSDCNPQQETNSRRHSTRNRPLTTKALEALACGFLSFTPKKEPRKSKRPCRRPKSKGGVLVSSSSNVGSEIEPESCVTKGSSDIVNELQVEVE